MPPNTPRPGYAIDTTKWSPAHTHITKPDSNWMGIFFLAPRVRPAECRWVSRGPTPERLKLALLFFLTAHALGLWSINFSTVLEAYGYAHLVADAWATTALAALVSPLIAGALADQRYSTELVLRWLALGAAFWLTLLFYAIDQHWHWRRCTPFGACRCSVWRRAW